MYFPKGKALGLPIDWIIRVFVYYVPVIVKEAADDQHTQFVILDLFELGYRPFGRSLLWDHLDHDAVKFSLTGEARERDVKVNFICLRQSAVNRLLSALVGVYQEAAKFYQSAFAGQTSRNIETMNSVPLRLRKLLALIN